MHREIATHEETIEALQDKIQTMQADHSRQMLDMQQRHRTEIQAKDTEYKREVSGLKRLVDKLCVWFPLAKEILRMESLCRLVGFDERQTATLVSGKPLIYEGELYSEEHSHRFTTEKAGFQVVKDPEDKAKLVLAMNRQSIGKWFREQFDKLRQGIRRPIQQQRESRGF